MIFGPSDHTNNLKNTRRGPRIRQDLSALLASLPEEQRRHRIGEEIYPLVQKHQPRIAGKITGMFLDMEVGELLGLLENPAHLRENITAAVRVLERSGAIEQEVKVMSKVTPAFMEQKVNSRPVTIKIRLTTLTFFV